MPKTAAKKKTAPVRSGKAPVKKKVKKTVSSAKAKPAKVTAPAKVERYYESVGRRKTAIARVRIWKSKTPTFAVNAKTMADHLQESEYQKIANEALEKGIPGMTFAVSVVVKGGGPHAQAEAIRQGISRGLVKFDEGLRPNLKTLGYLTRDPRMRERKKFGLKRARRARQWRKR